MLNFGGFLTIRLTSILDGSSGRQDSDGLTVGVEDAGTPTALSFRPSPFSGATIDTSIDIEDHDVSAGRVDVLIC